MIVTNNSKFDTKIRQIRSFGHNKVWGTNLRMTRVQCAVGISQLNKVDKNNLKRIKVAIQRNEMFLKYNLDIKLPIYDSKYYAIYTYYTIILGNSYTREDRDKIRAILLNEFGIDTCVANEPTYITHKYIDKVVFHKQMQSYELGGKIINLPISFRMGKKDNNYIVNSFVKALSQVKGGDIDD